MCELVVVVGLCGFLFFSTFAHFRADCCCFSWGGGGGFWVLKCVKTQGGMWGDFCLHWVLICFSIFCHKYLRAQQ